MLTACPMPGNARSLDAESARRALAALLLLALAILTNGCEGDVTLFIRGSDKAAVGELAAFDVMRNAQCGGKFGGPSDPTGVFSVCPGLHGLKSLLDVACDGDACVVDSVDPPDAYGAIRVKIIGNTAGPAVLRIRAAVDDGSELSGTVSLSFVTATGLHVGCGAARAADQTAASPFGQCGGLYPVFTDAGWRWQISFDSDSGLLQTIDPLLSLKGDTVTFDGAGGWFQSGSTTGTTQVTISSRQFTKTVPVRVTSVDDVVGGELRVVTPTDGIEQEIAQLGPAPSTLWYPGRNGLDGYTFTSRIMPLLTLSDGAQVYGGGGLFASDHPDVCSVASFPAGTDLMQETELEIDCKAVGSVTFAAPVGATTITWPVTVVPPPNLR